MSEAAQTRMGGGGNTQDKGAKPVELDFVLPLDFFFSGFSRCPLCLLTAKAS